MADRVIGADFRPIVDAISRWKNRSGQSVYWAVIAPWISENTPRVDAIKRFAELGQTGIPRLTPDDLWDLYSLSRFNELLIESFQDVPGAEELYYDNHRVSAEEYGFVCDAFQFRKVSTTRFTPFLHEVVEVIPSADPSHEITLVEELWPALMLGTMVFQRAGVVVEGGANHIVKEFAEKNPLFWAWRRRHREVRDLSHGWGSNSQWRTDFRRDYILNGAIHCNVDGESRRSMMKEENDLTESARHEFLLHRCLITTASDGDEWPYDETESFPFDMEILVA